MSEEAIFVCESLRMIGKGIPFGSELEKREEVQSHSEPSCVRIYMLIRVLRNLFRNQFACDTASTDMELGSVVKCNRIEQDILAIFYSSCIDLYAAPFDLLSYRGE